ncbi:hypothetical protein ABZP36_011765 [Zizania latifolia]
MKTKTMKATHAVGDPAAWLWCPSPSPFPAVGVICRRENDPKVAAKGFGSAVIGTNLAGGGVVQTDRDNVGLCARPSRWSGLRSRTLAFGVGRPMTTPNLPHVGAWRVCNATLVALQALAVWHLALMIGGSFCLSLCQGSRFLRR